MKLSEFMKLGATLRPQAFGHLFSREGGSCALGAAMEAAGITTDPFFLKDGGPLSRYVVEKAFPILCERNFRHPEDESSWSWDIWSAIVDLNNRFRWSREAIAEWVATIEEAQAEQIAAWVATVEPPEPPTPEPDEMPVAAKAGVLA